jgi:hypothetical protein
MVDMKRRLSFDNQQRVKEVDIAIFEVASEPLWAAYLCQLNGILGDGGQHGF